ncbi:MAG TPA: YbjN domain-containing protein [Thermoguttaceae bacterium]|nr:YbjN domain-containing protein [Thermoguttaceae bacterium]
MAWWQFLFGKRGSSAQREGVSMYEALSEDQVSVDVLERVFQAAFLRTERDTDGDLLVRDESGINTFVRVDSERKIVTFFSLWGLKEEFPEGEKLRLANELNYQLVVVRFTVRSPRVLWCDHQFLYAGGMSPITIIAAYRRFVSVCREVPRRDMLGIVGTD